MREAISSLSMILIVRGVVSASSDIPAETWRCFTGRRNANITRSKCHIENRIRLSVLSFPENQRLFSDVRRTPEEPWQSKTHASWHVFMDASSGQHFPRGFIVIGCLRYFGGFHSSSPGTILCLTIRRLFAYHRRLRSITHAQLCIIVSAKL